LGIARASLLRSSAYTHPLLRESASAMDWLSNWSDERRPVLHLQDEGLDVLVSVLLSLTVLLVGIALVNVLTLLLARGAVRRREIALRAVLGATRRRLIGQLLTEGALLLLVGGGLGLLLAIAGTHLLQTSWLHATPPWSGLAGYGWVFVGILGGFLGTTLLAWLSPVGVAWRRDLRRFLTTGGRATAGRGEALVRNALTILQLAASLILLTSAGLLLRGFASSPENAPEVGFDPRDTLTVQLRIPGAQLANTPDRVALYEEVLQQVRSLPGVVDASVATPGAWVGLGTIDPVHVLTGNPVEPGYVKLVQYNAVGPGYFSTLRAPVLRGREFAPEDQWGAEKVVVVNEAFVRRFRMWGDPVGKRLQLHGMSMNGAWYTIIGVVKDVRAQGIGIGIEPSPALYLSALQHPPLAVGLVVRTIGSPMRLAPGVLEAVRAVAPRAGLTDVLTMEEYLTHLRAPLRWFAVLFAVLASAALLLAASGLYGVMSYNVTRRTREIGIRMALGARTRDVIRMVLGQGLRLTGLGSVLGLMGALGLARLLQLRFRGVDPLDPLVYGGIAVVLTSVALLASYGPAQRAGSVDPQISLREE
ncbi:MAG: ABC transporter permease, partial [Chloroflexota bacterium]|nr:ABC transporter permease [Chloroflexota bacterium]